MTQEGKKHTVMMSIRGALVLFLGWLFTTVFFGMLIVFSVLTLRHWSHRVVAPAGQIWSRVLFALASVRLVYDNEPLSDRQARVVITNHPSNFDIVTGGLFLTPGGVAIGKRELIYIPGFNLVWWALRFELIDRSRARRAHRTLAGLAERIRGQRLTVIMTPEGTRSRDGKIQPFKKGAFHLAMQAGVPIVPVVTSGGFAIWPRHRWTPVPGVWRMRTLPPVSTEDWTPKTLDQHITEVRESMIAALEDMQAE
jgi:1-acyl-sn-glycerol-3-phosphate acyltransferase